MELSGCAAVVTGGASGLGEATARLLARQGVKVAIFDLNDQAGLAVADQIGGVFCRVDVTDDFSVDNGLARRAKPMGRSGYSSIAPALVMRSRRLRGPAPTAPSDISGA